MNKQIKHEDLAGDPGHARKLVGLPSKTVEQKRAEARIRTGNALIISGFVVAVIGIVLYCAACFSGGINQEMSAILFDNVVPFARATLAVIGIGTLLWLVGSMMYLKGAMDTDFDDQPKL